MKKNKNQPSEKLSYFKIIETREGKKLVQTINGDGQVINVSDIPTMEKKYRRYLEETSGGKFIVKNIRYIRPVTKDYIDDYGYLLEVTLRRVAPEPKQEPEFNVSFYDWSWYRDFDTFGGFLKAMKYWPIVKYEDVLKWYRQRIHNGPEIKETGIVDIYGNMRDKWEIEE